MTPILEPILAGILVSLINKFILNNNSIWNWCSPQEIVIEQHEDTISSSNTTISDISFEEPHIHVH